MYLGGNKFWRSQWQGPKNTWRNITSTNVSKRCCIYNYSWWLKTPFEKHACQIWSSVQIRVNILNKLKPPPREPIPAIRILTCCSSKLTGKASFFLFTWEPPFSEGSMLPNSSLPFYRFSDFRFGKSKGRSLWRFRETAVVWSFLFIYKGPNKEPKKEFPSFGAPENERFPVVFLHFYTLSSVILRYKTPLRAMGSKIEAREKWWRITNSNVNDNVLANNLQLAIPQEKWLQGHLHFLVYHLSFQIDDIWRSPPPSQKIHDLSIRRTQL